MLGFLKLLLYWNCATQSDVASLILSKSIHDVWRKDGAAELTAAPSNHLLLS